MRRLLWIAALAAPSFVACNYTVGECYPRGQGEGNAGVGGGDVILIPSGAGGGLGAEPPEPGGASGSIACNSDEEPEPEFGKPADKYINCSARGLNAAACSEACLTAGASCVPLALHPHKSGLEPGKLIYCKNGWPTYTCTWKFANGDGCTLITTPMVDVKWICKYDGG